MANSKDLMVLYGRNSVFERLKANPASITKIFLQDSFNVRQIDKSIKANKIPTEYLSPLGLTRIKHSKDLQGIVARINRFRYTSFGDLLDKSKDKQSTLVFLDRINDPQNLGVIIRILACFGGFSVIIPEFEACAVNETVMHVASGGENYVSVSMVPNLSNAIIEAKENGYWILGAEVDENLEDINKISLPFPLGLVLGSEGKGIRHGLQKRLDLKAHIPMHGSKISFNVSMACAIFCNEIVKQRKVGHSLSNKVQ